MRGGLMILGLLGLTACTGRVTMSDTGGTSSGEATTAGEVDSSVTPTSAATGSDTTDAPTTTTSTTSGTCTGTTIGTSTGMTSETTSDTTEEVSGGTSTGMTTTTDTSSSGGSEDSSTGAPAIACASRCAQPKTIEGDVIVMKGQSTKWLECVTHVTGNVDMWGELQPWTLEVFADLQEVGGELSLTSNDLVTDIEMLRCLRTVNKLSLNHLQGLTDLSPLAELEHVGSFSLIGTGVTTLATLPALKGVRTIGLSWNHELVDLAGLETWEVTPNKFTLSVSGHQSITSLAAVAPLLAQAVAADPLVVSIDSLPLLTSLAGLEPMKQGMLKLGDLPSLTNLEPLAQLEQAKRIALAGLPQVSSLHGLHNLKTVSGGLEIGSCELYDGLDGLTSLAGLDSLTTVGELSLARNDALTGLAGAPMLQQVNSLQVFDNQNLPAQAVDDLLAQLGAPPQMKCLNNQQCDCVPPP